MMPVLIDLPALAVMCVAALVLMILLAYRATIGALVIVLINVLEKATVSVLGFSFNVFQPGITLLEGINNIMYAALGKVLAANQWGWHKFIHWNAYMWDKVTEAAAETAHATGQALHILRRYTIPALIAATTGPFGSLVYAFRKQIAHLFTQLAHLSATLVHEIPKVVINVKTQAAAIPKAIHQTIPAAISNAVAVPWGAIGQLRKGEEAARANIAKLRRYVVGAGAAALVAGAIGRLGFGWARCSRVGRLGRAVCGMDDGLLESLLAGALLIASTISIVEFAKSCQAFTDAVEAPLKDFVRELRDLNPVKAPNASTQLAAYIAGNY